MGTSHYLKAPCLVNCTAGREPAQGPLFHKPEGSTYSMISFRPRHVFLEGRVGKEVHVGFSVEMLSAEFNVH